MNYRYELNLRLFELCVELSNSWRWNGFINQQSILSKNEESLEQHLYDFFEYGIILLIDGRSPEMLNFLLDEEIEVKKENTNISLKDFRLVKQVISWMKLSNNGSIHELVNSIEDQKLKNQYRDWCVLNEYESSLKFSDSLDITIEQRIELMKSNPVILNYYDNM